MWTADSGLVMRPLLCPESVGFDQEKGKYIHRCVYCNTYSIIEEEKRGIIVDCYGG